MEIKLQESPVPVTFPAGIELRPFIKDEHGIAVWQADTEVFHDHWSSHDRTYEEWSHEKFGNPNFDPTLWMVAWDGNEIAGFSQNRFRQGIGWVGTIAVRRPWRKRGLARALIVQSMKMFKDMGMTETALGVDTENLSGALRVYESCGYKKVKMSITLRKPLE